MNRSESPQSTRAWTEVGDGAAELDVLAVRMPLRAFVATIVLIVLGLGAAAAGVLIVLDSSGLPVGRWLVILLSGLVGIVASIGLIQTMRLRRRRWRVRIDAHRVTVSSSGWERSIPLSELELVRLRRRTDYARIVFVGRDSSTVSLLAGLGIAPEPGDTAAEYLPTFSPEVESRLRAAGLVEQRSPTSPDLTLWVRVA